MAARRHVAFISCTRVDVDHAVKKVGLAMLATKVLVHRFVSNQCRPWVKWGNMADRMG